MKNPAFLLVLLFSLRLTIAQAQAPATRRTGAAAAVPTAAPAEPAVFPSPAGVYAFVSIEALSAAHPKPDGVVAVRIMRAAAGSNSFKEVGRVQQATSLAEFRQQASQAALDEIKQANKLTTDDAAWAYILAHPHLDDYGLLPLDLSFRVAMGTAGLDAEAAKAPAGARFTYRLVPEYAAGRGPSRKEEKAIRYPEATVAMGQPSALPRPRLRRAIGRDSLVVVRWMAPAAPAGSRLVSLFGRVWGQGPGEAGFRVVADRLLANRTAKGRDSVSFTLEQRVRPEAQYRYYLEMLDVVGNPGPASDTATVLSVSVDRMPLIGKVTGQDTATGVVLKWTALPAKPYLFGIEIQRSRDTRGNYVRLDTIPATATRYLDQRLLPNVMYHYRLRALLRGPGLNAPDMPTGAIFASYTGGAGRTAAPLAPVQLTAVPEKRGVRLRWLPAGPDLNHHAYLVYRGTSALDSLAVVSPSLQDGLLTFLDTTARNGRIQYVYAVKAINKNLQSSPRSILAYAQPNHPMPVTAPAGLEAYANGTTLHLNWEDARRRDPAIVGYRLYRRPATAISAGKTGFSRIGPPDLVAAAYEDYLPDNRAYQYAVAAVDAQGTESAWSPVAAGQAAVAILASPSQLNARPLPTGLELNWSAPAQAPPKGYALYRRVREQTEAQRLATLTPSQTTYLDPTAKPGTLYIYSLAALGPTQESERTPEISARR